MDECEGCETFYVCNSGDLLDKKCPCSKCIVKVRCNKTCEAWSKYYSDISGSK